MQKNKIIKKETEELLEGVEGIEESFEELESDTLGVLAEGPDFFDDRAEDCEPLIENCEEALKALPKITPPTCKIRRKQYKDVKKKLETLIDDFEDLQESTDTVLNPATEATTKTSELLTIAAKLPDVIKEFAFMKKECEKIKKAMLL